MWEFEHGVETEAPAAAIWALLSDVARWHEWNQDLEAVEIDGPFVQGSTITMTPQGQEAVELRLVEVLPEEAFVDEADLGHVVVRTVHRIETAEAGRRRVVYHLQVSGPAADELGPVIGPAITADFPDTMAALVALAGA